MQQAIAKSNLFESAEEMGEELLRMVKELCLWQMEPWSRKGVFDFGDEDYYRRGIAYSMALWRKNHIRYAPFYLWQSRSFFACRGLDYKLKGRADLNAIITRERSVD